MRHHRAVVTLLIIVVLVGAAGHNATAQSCSTDICTTCDRPADWIDNDYDGIPDSLEYDLAQRFFPTIWLQGYDYDLAVAYLYLGYTIPYSVQPYTGGICDQDRECL